MVKHPAIYRDKVSQLITWGHWFCFANIILALICGLRFLILAHPPETFLGQAYLIISWLSQFAFLPFALYLLSLFPLSFIVPSNRSLRFIGAVVATTAIGLLVVDGEFYANFNLHLTPQLLQLLIDKEQNTQANTLNLLFVTLPLLFLIELWLAKICWKYRHRLEQNHIGWPVAFFFFATFVFTHLVHAWADATSYTAITQQKNNFPAYYPLTARSFLQQQGLFDVDAYQQRLKAERALGQSSLHYPIKPLNIVSHDERYNVLYIVVEGLRADMLQQQTMPNTWKHAQNYSQFFNHYSGGNNQQSGLYSLFYALPSAYWQDLKALKRQPLLFDALEEQNYQLAWFERQDSQLHARSLKAILSQGIDETISGQGSDQTLIQQWLAWQRSPQSLLPWFNMLYLNGVANFEAEQQAEQLNEASIKQQYQAAVQQLDQHLQEILSYLARAERYKNTIVIITADRGYQLRGKPYQQLVDNSNFSPEQTQVPMLIHWPNKQPILMDERTSHLDIVPTLMKDLLDVNNRYSDYSSGQNIFGKRNTKWLLLGNEEQHAVLEKNTLTLLTADGEYQVMDLNMQPSHAKLSMSSMVQVLNELKRFQQPVMEN